MPINVLGTHFNAHYFPLFLSSKLMAIICQVVNGHYFSYKINGLLMPDFFYIVMGI